MASNQKPIANETELRKLRALIDKGIQCIPYKKYKKSDEDSTDWKAVLLKIKDDIYDVCTRHPTLIIFLGAMLAGVAVALIIPVLLQVAGFGASGPVAGSFAAAWQSSIGDVAAGSFFAWLQSIGMAPATAQVTGGLIAFGVFLWVELVKNSTPDDGSDRAPVDGPIGNKPPGNRVPENGEPADGTLGHRSSGGLGRRALNPLRPLYDGYRVVRYGFTGTTRFRG